MKALKNTLSLAAAVSTGVAMAAMAPEALAHKTSTSAKKTTATHNAFCCWGTRSLVTTYATEKTCSAPMSRIVPK